MINSCSIKWYDMTLHKYLIFFCSNDSADGEPEEKRRKMANVILNQPVTDSRLLVENTPDEVWYRVMA